MSRDAMRAALETLAAGAALEIWAIRGAAGAALEIRTALEGCQLLLNPVELQEIAGSRSLHSRGGDIISTGT